MLLYVRTDRSSSRRLRTIEDYLSVSILCICCYIRYTYIHNYVNVRVYIRYMYLSVCVCGEDISIDRQCTHIYASMQQQLRYSVHLERQTRFLRGSLKRRALNSVHRNTIFHVDVQHTYSSVLVVQSVYTAVSSSITPAPTPPLTPKKTSPSYLVYLSLRDLFNDASTEMIDSSDPSYIPAGSPRFFNYLLRKAFLM